MRKNYLFLLFAAVVFQVNSQVIENEIPVVEDENPVDTLMYEKGIAQKALVEYNKWSVFANGGLGYYFGQDNKAIKADNTAMFVLDLGVEHTFNPIVGLGLAYRLKPITASADRAKFKGLKHSPMIFLSLNLSGLLFNTNNWGIYTNYGFGVNFYDTECTASEIFEPLPALDGRNVFFMMGFNMEYNFSKRLALAWANQFRFNIDNVNSERHLEGSNFSTSLGLRYKFIGNKKDNIRNLTYKEWAQKVNAITGSSLENEKEPVMEEPETLLEEIMPEEVVENILEAPEEVIIPQEEENIEQEVVEVPEEIVVPQEIESIAEKVADYQIFFAFDSADFNSNSIATVRKIALQMRATPELKLEIRGYADDFGSQEANQRTSVKRAEVAKKVLVEIHKIDESRIKTEGLGSIAEPKGMYAPNRRSDFFLD
jgi:outer membrane protein OmpA-like peptidoglycan-associated protein